MGGGHVPACEKYFPEGSHLTCTNSPWSWLSSKDWASTLFSWPSLRFAHLCIPLWSFYACIPAWIMSLGLDNFLDWVSFSESRVLSDFWMELTGLCWPTCLPVTMPKPLAGTPCLISLWCDFLPGNSTIAHQVPASRRQLARSLGPELCQSDLSIFFQVAFPVVEFV